MRRDMAFPLDVVYESNMYINRQSQQMRQKQFQDNKQSTAWEEYEPIYT